MQAQPAPIERATEAQPAPTDAQPANSNDVNAYPVKLTPGEVLSAGRGTASAVAAPGVFVRIGHGSAVRAISLTTDKIELKVERGVANVSIHNAQKDADILVDLPGGQTTLVKDGFYTFNANTNTARVLRGEAYAYPGANMQGKPIKIKENHAVIYNGLDIRPFEFDPFEARADLVPYPRSESVGPVYYGPYAGFPYYDYGYPFWYNPFYVGFGWGYYGGWGRGFYGGWGGGWRGGWGGYRGGWRR